MATVPTQSPVQVVSIVPVQTASTSLRRRKCVTLPTLVSMAVLAALSIHSAQNAENWRPLGPYCPSGWETKPAGTVGIWPSGATGGGGDHVYPIGDLAAGF